MITPTVQILLELMHGVIILVGSGKTGKSCGGHAIAELFWPDRPKYVIDPEQLDLSMFPEGYHYANNTTDIPPGSIIFIEDVNRVFNSRSSGFKSSLQKWLATISHKDYIIILTTQSYADTDMAFGRSQNTIYLHKYMWEDDIGFERDELKIQQVAANEAIETYAYEHPDVDFRAIVYCARYGDLLLLPVPEWWKDGVHSHIFREVAVSLM